MAEDKPNIGLIILSFICPLIGWILYFVNRDKSPEKASAYSLWAWIGFGFSFFLKLISKAFV